MSRVAPRLLQSGNQVVDATTGDPVYLRGGGIAVAACIGNTMYKTIVTLFAANYLTIRVTWDGAEPTAPTGGNPATGTPGTRNYGATYMAKFTEMMAYCQDNGVYFTVRMSHTGGDGVPAFAGGGYFGGSTGWAGWMYDPAYWGGGLKPPLPRDKIGFGADYYPATSDGGTAADTAFWMPYAGDSLLVGVTTVHSDGVSKDWRGDHEYVYAYLYPFLKHLQDLSQIYDCCVAYNWFNEPDYGDLKKTSNYNTANPNVTAVERMIKTQTIYLDALRADEPDRMFSMHGLGGHNYTGTPDFSLYWTSGVGGGGVCPDTHHFYLEQHLYISGQGTLTPNPPGDASDSMFNQTQLGDLSQQQLLVLNNFSGTDHFKLTWNRPSGSGGPVETATTFTRGSNTTAAAMQTAIRAIDASLSAATVSGTTDVGPFTVTFAAPTYKLSGTSTSGCSVDEDDLDDTSGKTDDEDVYAGDQDTVNEIVGILTAHTDAWGVPLSIGEFGIGAGVIDAGQFVVQLDTAFRLYRTPMVAVFFMGTGTADGNKSVLTDLGGDTYALRDPVGSQWAVQLESAYAPPGDRVLVGVQGSFGTTDSDRCPMPPGCAAGDYAVIFASARGADTSGGRAFTTPTGFSPINVGNPLGHGHDSTFITVAAWGGTLDASNLTQSGAISGLGAVHHSLTSIVYRNCGGVDQATIQMGSVSENTIPASDLTPTQDDETIIFFGAIGQSTVTQSSPNGTPDGFSPQTEAREAVSGGNLAYLVATLDQGAAALVTGKEWTTVGSGHHGAIMVSVTTSTTGGGGGGGGQVFRVGAGIGQGHIDHGVIDGDDSPSGQDKTAWLARRVAGENALVRCDFSFGKIVKNQTFTDAYFNGNSAVAVGRRNLYTALGKYGDRLYCTFHLDNSSPVPPKTTIAGVVRMLEWQSAVAAAMGFLSGLTAAPGSITPFAADGWKQPVVFEILNEPNGVSGGNVSATDCWIMLREAAAAIRSSEIALSGAEVLIYGPALAGAANPIPYLQAVQAAAVAEGASMDDWLDGVGIHCYWNQAPDTPAVNDGKTVGIPLKLDNFQAAITALGLNLHWIISEGGYSGDNSYNRFVGSGPPDVEYETAAAAKSAGYTGISQSEWLGGALDLLKSKIQSGAWDCDGIILYQIFDMAPPADAVRGGRFWRNNLALANYTSGAISDAQLKEAADVYLSKVTAANVAPTVTPVEPVSGSSTDQTSILVSCDVFSDDDVTSVECRINTGSGFGAPFTLSKISGDPATTARYSGTGTIAKSASPGTTNHVQFRSTDASLSQLVSDWVDVTVIGITSAVDAVDPVVTVTAPASDITVSADDGSIYVVKGTVTDNVGVARCTVNGIIQALNGSAFAQEVMLVTGDNPVVVVGRDLAGNEETVTRTITVVSNPPVIDQIVYSDDQLTISVRVEQRGIS